MPTPQEVQQLLNQVEKKKDFERQEAKHKETNTKLDSINESIKSLDLKSDVGEIVNAVKDIKIESPNVTVNVPDVIVPEIKLPDIKVDAPIIPPIKVPTPQVTVNVPEPKVIIQNQEEIKVTEPNWLNKIVNPIVEAIKNKVILPFVLPKTASEAIPVRLSNGKKFYEVFSNISTSIAGAVDTSKLATSAKQLPDNHQVTVSNQIIQPTTPTDTQPISAVSLPLPTGASTEAKQNNTITELQTLNSVDFATETKQDTIIANQTNSTQKTQIVDGTGTVWTMEPNGAMPINIQDQHSQIVDLFFRQVINTVTLASNATINTNTLTLVAGHGVVAGNTIVLKENAGTHFYQADVLSVVGDVLTMDSLLDFSFTTTALGQRCTKNLAVNGSVTPQTFFISPAGLSFDVDITSIIFSIEDNTAMDPSTFGGIAKLTNGILVRSKNGITKNLFNAKDNDGFSHHCEDVIYTQKIGGGSYQVRAIRRFAGQSNDGVTIRLNSATSDALQVIIQDDLTALTEFNVTARGHIVVNY